jgi:galactose mutarotase-like enzyme
MFVDVEIQENRVKTWMSATNNRLAPIPILPALHPYFTTPTGELNVIMDDKEVAHMYPNGETLNVGPVPKVIPKIGPVSIRLGGLGTVRFCSPTHCTHIVIWSDNPSAYVCVEPVFGTPGTFGLPGGATLNWNEQVYSEVTLYFTPLE